MTRRGVSPKLRSSLCDKSGIPPTEQSISYDGRELSNTKATMEELGVSNDAMLLFRRKINVAGRCASRTLVTDSERHATHSFDPQDS